MPRGGHEDAWIGVYDVKTGLLLPGDTVYPGRLYVRDMPAFLHSFMDTDTARHRACCPVVSGRR